MPTTAKPPLSAGTPVTINVAQGMSIARGVITAAEYDDGWLYRIDITDGDDCQIHRNADGELWVCEFEVAPSGSRPAAEYGATMPHTVEVVGDSLVVLDEDGNGCDCHELTGLRRAKRQLRRWQEEYIFHYAEAIKAVSEFFSQQESE